MLNLSKNGIELLRTHSVVGIEPVWILSQILIQSVKLTKILTCLIYRVYPILSIVFFHSMIKKQCSCCLSPIHNDNGKIYIEMLQNATFTTFIYYLLENTQQCKLPLSNYMGPLSMEMVKQTAVQPVSTGKFALQQKKSHDKKGSRAKKIALGKNHSEFATKKRAMCAWDHWNSIGVNPARYRCEFATSKTPRIRAMCVMSLRELHI